MIHERILAEETSRMGVSTNWNEMRNQGNIIQTWSNA